MKETTTLWAYFFLSEEQKKKIAKCLKSPVMSEKDFLETIDYDGCTGTGGLVFKSSQYVDGRYMILTIFTYEYTKHDKRELKGKIVAVDGELELVGNPEMVDGTSRQETMVLATKFMSAEDIENMLKYMYAHIRTEKYDYQVGTPSLEMNVDEREKL